MQKLAVTFLMSGGLITNYYCASRCRHCLYRCSPQWPKDYINPEVTRSNLETMKKMQCRSIHISGGEPLLNPEGLLRVLEIANDTGMHVEYVETNSAWFKNYESARSILKKLAENGLSTLLISISPFHNEHVPFYKVKSVIKTCHEVGISIFPWISDFFPEIDAMNDRNKHSLEEYKATFGVDYENSILHRYWVSAGGRALDLLVQHYPSHPLEEILQHNNGGCPELANTSHFHIDLYGNYIPGLCAGLSIRRQDLGVPLSETEYPLLTLLYNHGVGGLLQYAKENYDFKPAKTGYAHKCELCAEIRFFLVNQAGVTSHELQPVRHYGEG